jgi:hypothetical protein
MSRHAYVVSLSTLALIASGPAFAADVPGSVKTKSVVKVSDAQPTIKTGQFEFLGDSDWHKIKLVANHDYSFAAAPGICNTREELAESHVILNLRNAKGKLIKAAGQTDCYPDDDGPFYVGFEFHTSKAATYFLEYKQAGPAPVPFPYRIIAAGDCRFDAKTLCTLAVGQSRKGFLTYQGDRDAFKTTLQAGQTYIITLFDPIDGQLTTALHNSTGAIIQNGGPFTPTTSGIYFASVGTDADGGSFDYEVSLSKE